MKQTETHNYQTLITLGLLAQNLRAVNESTQTVLHLCLGVACQVYGTIGNTRIDLIYHQTRVKSETNRDT